HRGRARGFAPARLGDAPAGRPDHRGAPARRDRRGVSRSRPGPRVQVRDPAATSACRGPSSGLEPPEGGRVPMALGRPITATAAVYYAPGDLRIEEVPLPPLGRGEMLVRIRACGLCPGEVMDWYMARKAPVPLGHEPVGEVVEAADGVAFRPGDRVFVHHHAPCLTCRVCRRGDFVHCATWRPRRLLPGGLATHAIVQAPAVAADVVRLPEGLSDDAATFVEPLACVVKSVRRARVREGDGVLVIGLGVMGLLHLHALRALSAPGLLLAADRVPERLDRGRAVADVVIDTSRVPLTDAVARAATSARSVVGRPGAAAARVSRAFLRGPGSAPATPSRESHRGTREAHHRYSRTGAAHRRGCRRRPPAPPRASPSPGGPWPGPAG